MPELVFLRRGEEVLRFTLDRPRIVLGRGDRCDVVIPDPEVSRQQVLLLISGRFGGGGGSLGQGNPRRRNAGGAGAPRRRGRDRARAVARHLPRPERQHRGRTRDRGARNGRPARGRCRVRTGATGADPPPPRRHRVGPPADGRGVHPGEGSGERPGARRPVHLGEAPARHPAGHALPGARSREHQRHLARAGSRSSRPRCRCTPSSAWARPSVLLEPATAVRRDSPAAWQGLVGSGHRDARSSWSSSSGWPPPPRR